MGNTSSIAGKFGAKSTAKEIVNYFASTSQNDSFLAGKTVLITGCSLFGKYFLIELCN